MARIPIEPTGRVIPQGPGQGWRVPAGAFDSGGEALARAGQAVGRMAGQTLDDEQRVQEQQQREEKQRWREEQHRMSAAADKAEQAREAMALIGAEDALATAQEEITDGLRTGKVPKDKAEELWAERSSKIVGAATPQFRTDRRELVQAQLQSGVNKMGRGVAQAREQRDRQDVTVDIDGILEAASRGYARDPAQATARVETALRDLGPTSLYSPQELARKGQAWKETAQYTSALGAVNGARRDNRALQSVEKMLSSPRFADMDERQKTTLLGQIDNYRASNDAAALRAQHSAEIRAAAADRKARLVVDGVQKLADGGMFVDPQWGAEQIAKLKNMPEHQAMAVALLKGAQAGNGLARQPLATQRATLDVLNAEIAQKGNNEQRADRLAKVEKVVRSTEADIKSDQLRGWIKRSPDDAAEFRPLNTSSLQALAQSFAARMPIAEHAAVWSGEPVSPLVNEEVGPVRKLIEVLPVKERAAALGTLAQALPPLARAGLAKQLDKDDKALGFALAAAGTGTQAGMQAAELTLKGQQALKDKTAVKDDKALTGWTATIATDLAGVYPNEEQSQGTADAAYMIAAGLAHDNGGTVSGKQLRRAVQMAAGGEIIEHNGRRLPLPAGITEDMLEKRLRAVSVIEIAQQSMPRPAAAGALVDLGTATVRAAGVQVPVRDFIAKLPGAELVYAGPGQYNVLVGGRPVLDSEGRRRITIRVQ